MLPVLTTGATKLLINQNLGICSEIYRSGDEPLRSLGFPVHPSRQ
jgi:hypothetical protein